MALQEVLEDFEATLGPLYDGQFVIGLDVLVKAGSISRPAIDAGYFGLYCETPDGRQRPRSQ